MNHSRRNYRTLISLAISLVLVYVLLFKPHIGAMLRGELGPGAALFGTFRIGGDDLQTALGHLRWLPILEALLLMILSLLLRGWRWQRIIATVGHAPYKLVFWSVNLGYLLNNVLPLRAGEFLRAVFVARRASLPVTALLTTVVLERAFDLAGLCILFGITLAVWEVPGWLKAGGVTFAVLVTLFILAAWVLAASVEKTAAWFHARIEGRGKLVTRIGRAMIGFLNGLSVLRSTKTMLHMLWSTLALWAMYCTMMKLFFDAFSFTDGSYPAFACGAWVEAAAMTVITSIGYSVPSAPGAVGTYHSAIVLGASYFGVPTGVAVVFAAALHALNYITLSGMGLLGLWALKLRWSDLVKQAKEAPPR